MGQKMPAIPINIKGVSQNPQWYIVVTKFNYEKKFAGDLQQSLKNSNIEDRIHEIVVPIKETEVMTKTPTGKDKKKIKVEKVYPAYVFVKASMNDEVWNFIRNTPGASMILATGPDLVTMNDREIDKIKELCGFYEKEKEAEKMAREEAIINFKGKIGDKSEIVSGIFSGFLGKINKVDLNKGKIGLILDESGISVEANIQDIRVY